MVLALNFGLLSSLTHCHCVLFSVQRFLNWDHSSAEILRLLWELNCSWLLPATDTSLHQTREPASSNNKQLVRGTTSQQQCTCCSNCRRDSPLTSRPERISKCRLGIAIAKGKVLTALLRNNLWPKPRLWSRLKMLWNHTPDTYAVLTSSFAWYPFPSLSLLLFNSVTERHSTAIFFQMLNKVVIMLNEEVKMQKLPQHSTVCSSLKQLYQFWILMRTVIWLKAGVAIICIMHCVIKTTMINRSLITQSKSWWGYEVIVPKQTSICMIRLP